MAITYKWSVNQVECYPTHEGQTNVVTKITWALRGVDENGVGSSRGGISSVTYEAGAPFTPFNELTEAKVLEWVKPMVSAEQEAEMKAGIVGDINWQIEQANANSPTTPALPWPIVMPNVE